jgi:hypothetical protein
MSEQSWNPWKLTAIGMAVVMVTALVTGLVVANWSGSDSDKKTAAGEAPAKSASALPRAASALPTTVAQAVSPPTSSAVDECNRYAANHTSSRDKTVDTLIDAGVGALVGAAVGAAGGAIADGGKGAGKGAAIGGVLGAGGGTLYGLNENKKHDQGYRDAYASCMRSRGYTG